MTVHELYFILILAALLIGGVIVAILLHFTFKKLPHIDMVQGRLCENTSDDFKSAIPYLKITNQYDN